MGRRNPNWTHRQVIRNPSKPLSVPEKGDKKGRQVMQKPPQHIRNLDPELYHKARQAALKANKTLGAWLNEAIRTSLNFEEEASQWARDSGWSEPS